MKDVDNLNESGWSKLMLAVESEDYDRVKALLESGADVNLKGIGGQTVLHIAVDVSIDSMRQRGLLESDAATNVISLLIKHGANINSKDDQGTSPLDWAKEYGSNKTSDSIGGSQAITFHSLVAGAF